MKRCRTFHYFYFLIVILFNCTISPLSIFNDFNRSNFPDSSYIEHAPIEVSNDAELAIAANGGGTGDINDPYIIENYNITITTGNAIYVHDTTKHFRIEDCLVVGAEQGILFHNVVNATIKNCTIHDCIAQSIRIDSSSDVLVINNTLYHNALANGVSALLVENSYQNITIQKNILYENKGNDACIKIRDCANQSIINNSIYDNYNDGIELGACPDFLIYGNYICNNTYTGIDIQTASPNYNLSYNAIVHNGQLGIELGAENGTIANNTFYNNTNYAIAGDGQNFNITFNNFVENNHEQYHVGFGDQVATQDIEAIFKHNFWFDLVEPDTDEDGIVDTNYKIGSEIVFFDEFPHTDPHDCCPFSFITKPLLITTELWPPLYGFTVKGEQLIEWNSSLDFFSRDITYSFWYSDNAGETWIRDSDYMASLSHVWNTNSLDDGLNYRIRIRANSTEDFYSDFVTEYDIIVHNYLPSPQLICPIGGEVIYGEYLVDWEDVIDPLGFPVNYTVQISYDGGDQWLFIDWKELSESEFLFDTKKQTENSCNVLIKITAITPDGLESSNVTNSVFAIVNDVIPPWLIPFKGRRVFNDEIMIEWLPAIDPQKRSLTYDIFYSYNDGLNWILIASNLTDTKYTWDISNIPERKTYSLKIVAKSGNQPLTSYEMYQNYFEIRHFKPNPLIIMFLLIGLSSVGGIVFWKWYNNRILRNIGQSQKKSEEIHIIEEEKSHKDNSNNITN
ncbi:MAG: hypothetical protein GF364_21885 [Candidatus Lokiarchaeota archaeon]|nr:hypothetical protein [Candidatus Lokiarchaeota archaeon]